MQRMTTISAFLPCPHLFERMWWVVLCRWFTIPSSSSRHTTRRQAGRPSMGREKKWMHQECTKDSDWISTNKNGVSPHAAAAKGMERKCIWSLFAKCPPPPVILSIFIPRFLLVPFLLPWCDGCWFIQLTVKNRQIRVHVEPDNVVEECPFG